MLAAWRGLKGSLQLVLEAGHWGPAGALGQRLPPLPPTGKLAKEQQGAEESREPRVPLHSGLHGW